MYTADLQPIKYKRVAHTESVRLPSLVEYYARNPTQQLSAYYWQLLYNWMRHLEQGYYKHKQHSTQDKHDATTDRIVLFVKMSRENASKDGALLLSMFRLKFGEVEMLLKLRRMRVGVVESDLPVLKQLHNATVRGTRRMFALKRKLDDKGLPITYSNCAKLWMAEHEKAKGKLPGKIAQENFKIYWSHFENVLNHKLTIERAWYSRGDSTNNY